MTTGLPAGPFAVAFHREWGIDTSRMWEFSPHLKCRQGRIGRPLRIDVWYPSADAKRSQPATLRAYMRAEPPDAYFASANKRLQDWDESSYKGF